MPNKVSLTPSVSASVSASVSLVASKSNIASVSPPTKLLNPGIILIANTPLFFFLLFSLVVSFIISPNLPFISSNLA